MKILEWKNLKIKSYENRMYFYDTGINAIRQIHAGAI